jgi:glycine oxidase
MKRVVVVGAGVIGLFCALRLAQRGAQVIVLEGEREEDLVQCSPTASLAAAGMLAPVSEAVGPPERHRALDQLALQSFDLWRAQSKAALWEDGVRFDGGLFLARDEAQAAAFHRGAEALGRVARPLTAAQWRKRSGFRAEAGPVLLVEDEGVADPLRVISGLAMDARRHGVQVLYGHDVDTATANAVSAFDHGVFEADAVLLAPGVWANDRLIAAAPALKHIGPARGHMVPVKLAHTLGANIHGDGFYLARHGAEDVVLGSTMEFDSFERRVDHDKVSELLGAAERALPGEVHLRHDVNPWVGVRPMSPDWAPLIGESGGLLVAAGHSRNGWLLAPVTAEMICAHVFGEALPPLWAAFTPDRFEVATT